MRSKNIINVVFILFVIYYGLSIIFPHDRYGEAESSGRIFPQITMTLTYITGTIIAFPCINKYKQFRSFFLFVILFWIYIVYSSASTIDTISYIMKSTSGFVFSVVFFRFLLQNEKLTLRWMTIIFFVVIVVGFTTHFTRIEENRFGETESPAGFIFSQLLSFSLLFSTKKWSPYAFLVCVGMCLISGQRTASLIAIIYCLCAFKIYQRSLNIPRIVFIVFLVTVVAWPFLIDAYDNLMMRNQRDLEGDSYGSGRALLYQMALFDIINSNPLAIILGKGIYSNVAFFEFSIGRSIVTHNGWIDTFYQFGLIGLTLFASCIISLFVRCKRIIKAIPQEGWVLLFMAISWVLKSSVSHGYLDLHAIPFSMSLAYIYYRFYNDSYINTRKKTFALSKQ